MIRLKEYLLREGATADKFAELEDTATEYSPYMFIDARTAGVDDEGATLRTIVPGPAIGPSRYVKKGDFIARILQSGVVKNHNPMGKSYVLDKKSMDLFTQLQNRKPDVEGFMEYETEGDVFQVVKDGSQYIMKKDKNITQVPASLFDKQFRPKAK